MSEQLPEPDDLFAQLEQEMHESDSYQALLSGLAEAADDAARIDQYQLMALDRDHIERTLDTIGAYAGDVDRLQQLYTEYAGSPHVRVPLDDDIRAIQQDFLSRYQELLAADPDEELSAIDACNLLVAIEVSTMRYLERLAVGDTIEVAPPAVVIDLSGEMISLPADMRLYGKFTGLSLGAAPDMMTCILQESTGVEDIAIALVLEDAVIVEPGSDPIVLTGEAGPVVTIPLNDILPIVHKIVR